MLYTVRWKMSCFARRARFKYLRTKSNTRRSPKSWPSGSWKSDSRNPFWSSHCFGPTTHRNLYNVAHTCNIARESAKLTKT